MGSDFSKPLVFEVPSILEPLFEGKKAKVLILGLKGAGKTTFLEGLARGLRMESEGIANTTLKTGLNVEVVGGGDLSFTSWDVGGQDKISPLWRDYFRDAQGMVFVVDSSDRGRISEASDVLHRILTEGELQREAVLLVLASKKDLPTAMTALEVTDKLGLRSLQQRCWHVQCASRDGGEDDFYRGGCYHGVAWLASNLPSWNDIAIE